MKKLFHLLLMLFTYPTRVADAINQAKSEEEFDRAVQNG